MPPRRGCSALAAVLVLDRDAHEGALTYARAGELAEKAGAPMLAIEAYRCAGQVALRAGSERGSIEVWQRALRVTSEAPPEVAGASSAPVVARALAKLAQDSGSFAAAQSLLDQADEFESRSSRHGTEARPEGIAHTGESLWAGTPDESGRNGPPRARATPVATPLTAGAGPRRRKPLRERAERPA